MNKITELLIQYSDYYFSNHSVPTWTKRCVSRIIDCYRQALGDNINICQDCGKSFLVANTCKTKNCPKCAFYRTYLWLEKIADILPTMNYQHIVFTIPIFLRPFFIVNFKVMTNIQFKAISIALKEYARSRCVLSFWVAVYQHCGEHLTLNPHLHVIAALGGLLLDHSAFKPLPYYYAKQLSKIYTTVFLKKLRRAFKQGKIVLPNKYAHLSSYALFTRFIDANVKAINVKQALHQLKGNSVHSHFIEQFCPSTLNSPQYKAWNVFAAPVKGNAPFAYIVRYLHHPPITQTKIISNLRNRIVLRLKNKTTGLTERVVWTPEQFMKRFCDQFPPKGFHNVRRGGLLAPSNTKLFNLLKHFLANCYQHMIPAYDDIRSQMYNYNIHKNKQQAKTCPDCGGNIVFFKRLHPNHPIYSFITKDNIKVLSYKELKLLFLCYDTT